MANIEQILRMSATERKAAYKAENIEKVTIDGNDFTDYGAFSFLWEKSYVKSPARSGDGSIGNLNSYATFITPHLKIDFSLMSIDSYRALMNLIYKKNEFTVTCYDVVNNQMTTNRMYFSTEEMPKLWTIARAINGEEWVELLGVQDYTVELIGTNSDLDLVSVRYIVNAPDGASPDFAIDEGEEDVYKGEELIIGGGTSIPNETFGGKYKFSKWNISPEGGEQGNYLNGYAYTINTDLVLYAQWDALTNRTLSYNYGVAYAEAEEEPNIYPANKKVVKDKAIGTLPPVPQYPQNEKFTAAGELNPYINGAWYKTPVKAENSGDVEVKETDLYWSDRDSSLYLLYDLRSYDLILKIERDEPYYYDNFYIYQANSSQYGNPIKYGSPITLPTPVREGYKFDGWYEADDFREETKFTATEMPARNYTLYGRWIKQ